MRKIASLVLSELATTWSLARVLLEHEKASTSPADQPYTEREILTLCLVEQFKGLVTTTTLTKVFDLHHSQAGKIVQGLVNRGVLKKSGKPVSKKLGRGAPLELGPKAEEELMNIKLGLACRFAYLYQELTVQQRKQMYELIARMCAAAKREVEVRIFGKPRILTTLNGSN